MVLKWSLVENVWRAVPDLKVASGTSKPLEVGESFRRETRQRWTCLGERLALEDGLGVG